MVESAVEFELFPEGCVVVTLVLLLGRGVKVKGVEVMADGCQEMCMTGSESLLL